MPPVDDSQSDTIGPDELKPKGFVENDPDQDIVFATHDSDVIGGEFKRANAYE